MNSSSGHAQKGQSGKFDYESSAELIKALQPEYQDRLDQSFRHPDSIQLNGYSLREFKSFYIALLILCAVHEYICYPWNTSGQPIPTSSLVMVRSRSVWIASLSKISRLPQTTCEKIFSDLTFNPLSKTASLCINPFVPIDKFLFAVDGQSGSNASIVIPINALVVGNLPDCRLPKIVPATHPALYYCCACFENGWLVISASLSIHARQNSFEVNQQNEIGIGAHRSYRRHRNTRPSKTWTGIGIA
jgi:hypothetical protein